MDLNATVYVHCAPARGPTITRGSESARPSSDMYSRLAESNPLDGNWEWKRRVTM